MALIDADRLDYYRHLERERIPLVPTYDARRGLADITAASTFDADGALAGRQAGHAATVRGPIGLHLHCRCDPILSRFYAPQAVQRSASSPTLRGQEKL